MSAHVTLLPPAADTAEHPPRAPHDDIMDATLPQQPTGPISADEMDRLAARAATAICIGTTDAAAGHDFIAGLLYSVAIPEQVASTFLKGRAADRGSQSIVDLASSLRALMVGKVLLDERGESVLDPGALAAGASFAGFCRKFMTTAALSEHRNLCRTYRVTPVHSNAANGISPQADTGTDIDDTLTDHRVREDEIAWVASTYEERARACPPLELLHLQADTLARAFDLPRPERPAAAADRARVLAELDQDPSAAYRAIRDQVGGQIIETPLGEMFAGCRVEPLESILEAGPEVAEVLARSAASDVPPLRQRIAAELSHRMLDPLPRNSRERRYASETLRRWLTKSSTIVGDEFSRGWLPKPDEQIADEAAEFVRAATMLILKGTFPEFSEPAQIDQWLTGQAEEIALGQALVSQRRRREQAEAASGHQLGAGAA